MTDRDHHPAASPAADGRVRLQRLMADAGLASRRECEAMIERGLVEVNGSVVTRLPIFVNPAVDRVIVDGRPLRLRSRAPVVDSRRGRAAAAADGVVGIAGVGGVGGRVAGGGARDRRSYIMLNKPDRVLCTTRDDAPAESARTTVVDLVQKADGKRIYPVGRLDYHSTGLVLLTDDGTLADRLTHARYGVTRTYRVTVKGDVRPDMLDDLARRVGVRADASDDDQAESHLAPASVRVARASGPDSGNSVLEVTLREGKNRQLRSVLEQMGCIVRKLTRVGLGPLRLGGVAVGQWRDLSAEEVLQLQVAGGLISERDLPPRRAGRSSRPGRGAGGEAGKFKPRPAQAKGAGSRTERRDRGGRGARPAGSSKPKSTRRGKASEK